MTKQMNTVEKVKISILAEDSVLFDSNCMGQHGLSILIEVSSGKRSSCVLMDTGRNGDAILFNMEQLAISTQIVKSVFLSHCHFDHTGGLIRIIQGVAKNDLPIFAHPIIYRDHFKMKPSIIDIGIPEKCSQEKVEKAGGKFIFISQFTEIIPGIFSSGEIPRRTNFEVEQKIFKMKDSNGNIIPDPITDDQSLFIGVKDLGLVVITGCGHAGIVNICTSAIDHTGLPLSAVIGGLHLLFSSKEVVSRTARALLELGLQKLFVGHCTGFDATVHLKSYFQKNLQLFKTGQIITF